MCPLGNSVEPIAPVRSKKITSLKLSDVYDETTGSVDFDASNFRVGSTGVAAAPGFVPGAESRLNLSFFS